MAGVVGMASVAQPDAIRQKSHKQRSNAYFATEYSDYVEFTEAKARTNQTGIWLSDYLRFYMKYLDEPIDLTSNVA